MKGPPFELKAKSPRTVLMFGDCGDDGLFWVEPMRFFYPSEAKSAWHRSDGQKRRWER